MSGNETEEKKKKIKKKKNNDKLFGLINQITVDIPKLELCNSFFIFQAHAIDLT